MAVGYNQRYSSDTAISRNKTPADLFKETRTVSVYQYVDDVLIGVGRDENGELYDMVIPVAINLYYSPEFGGVDQKFPLEDWKSTGKEIIQRGWYYQRNNISRATKDGREFGIYVADCMRTIEEAVNRHLSPIAPSTITKRVAPLWAWFTLMSTVILIVLLTLSVRV